MERDPRLESTGEQKPIEINIHTILTQLGIDIKKWEAYEEREKFKTGSGQSNKD